MIFRYFSTFSLTIPAQSLGGRVPARSRRARFTGFGVSHSDIFWSLPILPVVFYSCWIYHIIPWQQWGQWFSSLASASCCACSLCFLSAENMDPICQCISFLKVSVHDSIPYTIFSKQHGTWNPILAAIAQRHNSAHFNGRRVSLASNLVVETSGLRFELDLLYLKISNTWWVDWIGNNRNERLL